jgi:hypothetical protein
MYATHTPQSAGVECEIDIPSGHNAVVFVRRGSLTIQGKEVEPQGVALLHTEGAKFSFKSTFLSTCVCAYASILMRAFDLLHIYFPSTSCCISLFDDT